MTIGYGVFLNAVVAFLIVGFAMFMIVRSMNRMEAKFEAQFVQGKAEAGRADRQEVPVLSRDDSLRGDALRSLHVAARDGAGQGVRRSCGCALWGRFGPFAGATEDRPPPGGKPREAERG